MKPVLHPVAGLTTSEDGGAPGARNETGIAERGGPMVDGHPRAGCVTAHIPPNARWRLPLLLGPAILSAGGWALAALLSSDWTASDGLMVSMTFLAAPIVGPLLWSVAPCRRFRRRRSPRTGGTGRSVFYRPDGETLAISTPAGGGPSILVEEAPEPEIGDPILRLPCLRGTDGLRLLANGFVLSQVLVIAAVVATAKTLALLAVWPLALVWTLMPIAWMGFGESPWSTLVVSPGSARLETQVHYLFISVLRSSAVLEIDDQGSVLVLTISTDEGQSTERVAVTLPGGSVPHDVQARLVRWVFSRRNESRKGDGE